MMNKIYQNCTKLVLKVPFNRFYTSGGYKSAIALENLYPNSNLKLTTPSQPPNVAPFNGYIPINELNITYSRSTGPGGQNVNTVNTKVEVRFKVDSASWIDNDIKEKLSEKFKNKITKDGYLIFRSDLTRSQQLNLADCLEKIRTSVRSCISEEKPPSEETQEKIRRKLERTTRERLALKRVRSLVKNERQAPEIVL